MYEYNREAKYEDVIRDELGEKEYERLYNPYRQDDYYWQTRSKIFEDVDSALRECLDMNLDRIKDNNSTSWKKLQSLMTEAAKKYPYEQGHRRDK